MDRQTAVILECNFGIFAGFFAILWFVTMMLFKLIEPTLEALFNIFFWLVVITIILAEIFSLIKKNIDKHLQQQQTNDTPQLQLTSPSFASTIFCIHCGSQNDGFARFCEVCGASIE